VQIRPEPSWLLPLPSTCHVISLKPCARSFGQERVNRLICDASGSDILIVYHWCPAKPNTVQWAVGDARGAVGSYRPSAGVASRICLCTLATRDLLLGHNPKCSPLSDSAGQVVHFVPGVVHQALERLRLPVQPGIDRLPWLGAIWLQSRDGERCSRCPAGFLLQERTGLLGWDCRSEE
jgi:hypothetical protein